MSDTQPNPNFFVLGAAKSGTTALCHYLAQHPDVCFSIPKEPLFFESEYERGLAFYRDKYFPHWNGESAVGEGRVYNLFLPFVPPRIRDCFPGARLIAILRDPVARAFSHWWHRYSRGLETLSFETAIERNLEQVKSGLDFEADAGAERWRKGLFRNGIGTRYRLYLELGFYGEQLERYLALFPASQLEIVFYEDLVANPAQITQHLWRFLGVDAAQELLDTRPQNEQRTRARSGAVAQLLDFVRASGVRRFVPKGIRPHLRQLRDSLPEREAQRPPLSEATRAATAEHFEADSSRLRAIVQRDLSAWHCEGSRHTGEDVLAQTSNP